MVRQADMWVGNDQERRVAVYAGYSFGLIGHAESCGFGEYLSGVVVTPKWARRCAQELRLDASGCSPWREADEASALWDALCDGEESPSIARVVLDNGAFPAWRDGRELSLGEQLDGIHEAMEVLGSSVEWIIAPDVVADARATWARICACQLELRQYGLHRLLLPVQDGMDIASVAALANELEAGVFVGGSGWGFKARALLELTHHEVRWVHVGRASRIEELQTCAELGADAVDSSSFLRAQHANVAARDRYRDALVEYAHLRQTPVHEGHYPASPSRPDESQGLIGYCEA